MMSLLLWMILVLLGLILFLRRWKMLGHPAIPGPKGYPVIGSWGGLLDRTPQGMTTRLLELTKSFPGICKVENVILTSYLISDAALTHQICETRAQEFINHPQFGGSDRILTSKGLIGIRDDAWRKRRKQLSGHFISSKIAQMVSEIFLTHAAELVTNLDKVKEGETINIQPYFANMTMDVIGDAAFGTDFGAQKDPNNLVSQTVKSWLDAGAKVGLCALLPYWDKIPLDVIKKFFCGQNMLADMCAKVIDDRRKTGIIRNDLVQSLVELKDTDREHILGEALLFLVAGHETTSTTLTWAIFMLAKNPDIEKKLVEELENILGDEVPHQNNVHQLKYLDNIIHETLRFHPPALLTTRENSKKLSFGNYVFPAGSLFLIPIWALHHDDRYWENPEKFDPDRWLPENKTKHVHGAYLPFGLGPRMCIGYKFALMEAKVALAMIYKRYTFKYSQAKEPTVKIGTLWRPEQLLVDIYKRVL